MQTHFFIFLLVFIWLLLGCTPHLDDTPTTTELITIHQNPIHERLESNEIQTNSIYKISLPVKQDNLKSANKPVALKAPAIMLPETLYDFGKVKADSLENHKFIITNVGDESLEITSIRKSCGCTAANLGQSNLPSGESTELEIYLHVGNSPGNISRKVIIHSNDPNSPETTITLLAEVIGTKRIHFTKKNNSSKISNRTKSPAGAETTPISQNSGGIIRRSRHAQ